MIQTIKSLQFTDKSKREDIYNAEENIHLLNIDDSIKAFFDSFWGRAIRETISKMWK